VVKRTDSDDEDLFPAAPDARKQANQGTSAAEAAKVPVGKDRPAKADWRTPIDRSALYTPEAEKERDKRMAAIERKQRISEDPEYEKELQFDALKRHGAVGLDDDHDEWCVLINRTRGKKTADGRSVLLVALEIVIASGKRAFISAVSPAATELIAARSTQSTVQVQSEHDIEARKRAVAAAAMERERIGDAMLALALDHYTSIDEIVRNQAQALVEAVCLPAVDLRYLIAWCGETGMHIPDKSLTIQCSELTRATWRKTAQQKPKDEEPKGQEKIMKAMREIERMEEDRPDISLQERWAEAMSIGMIDAARACDSTCVRRAAASYDAGSPVAILDLPKAIEWLDKQKVTA
jgi:hypothetical protein